MNWPAVWGELRPILEPVLAGVVLELLRRILKAAKAMHADPATSAKVATTVLDVASLQSWARGVDVKLAAVGDHSGDLAQRADIDTLKRDMARVLQYMAEHESGNRGKTEGAAALPR